MKWFVRIVQGVLSVVFLMSGLMKLFVSSEEIQTLYTDKLGYGIGFMRMVGMVEALAAIGLIAGYRWPRFAVVSSGILAIIMAGATITTLVSGQGVAAAVVPFILLTLALLIMLFKTRTVAELRRLYFRLWKVWIHFILNPLYGSNIYKLFCSPTFNFKDKVI